MIKELFGGLEWGESGTAKVPAHQRCRHKAVYQRTSPTLLNLSILLMNAPLDLLHQVILNICYKLRPFLPSLCFHVVPSPQKAKGELAAGRSAAEKKKEKYSKLPNSTAFPPCEMESRGGGAVGGGGGSSGGWPTDGGSPWSNKKRKMSNEITFRGEGFGWEGRRNERHSDAED